MFHNRCRFLFNSSAVLLSFLCILWISFYPGTSFLEPFSLFYDLISSYYTKGKWQWRQGYLFCFSADFSPFDLKSSLNQKLSSLKAKVCFCDWQVNVSILSPNVFDTCHALSKFASQIKLICGGDQGVRIPCLGRKSQGPEPQSHKLQSPRVPDPRVSDHRIPGLRVSGLRGPCPTSQVLILDYAVFLIFPPNQTALKQISKLT